MELLRQRSALARRQQQHPPFARLPRSAVHQAMVLVLQTVAVLSLVPVLELAQVRDLVQLHILLPLLLSHRAHWLVLPLLTTEKEASYQGRPSHQLNLELLELLKDQEPPLGRLPDQLLRTLQRRLRNRCYRDSRDTVRRQISPNHKRD
jgi:hypothetical protein